MIQIAPPLQIPVIIMPINFINEELFDHETNNLNAQFARISCFVY